MSFATISIYFTFVFNSNSYRKDFFDLIKSYLNVKIYGFKDFKSIFFPSKNFNPDKFKKNIKKEKYFQVQFTYNISSKTPEFLYKEYLMIKDKTHIQFASATLWINNFNK